MTVPRRAPIQCLLIDLDDTLYECPTIAEMVADNIRTYMHTRLGFPLEEVEEKCRYLYLNYGTTLAGLVASGHKVDFDDWHAFVHGTLPYEKFLKADEKLKRLLDSIPLPKYIFTNADEHHAHKCLDLMDLRSCFQGIICFETIMDAAKERGIVHHNKPVICKPNRQAFELALEQANKAHASTTAFFDDSIRNVTSAHHMGIFSVLIGRTNVECAAHMQVRDFPSVGKHLPWLFAGENGHTADNAEQDLEESQHELVPIET